LCKDFGPSDNPSKNESMQRQHPKTAEDRGGGNKKNTVGISLPSSSPGRRNQRGGDRDGAEGRKKKTPKQLDCEKEPSKGRAQKNALQKILRIGRQSGQQGKNCRSENVGRTTDRKPDLIQQR